AVLAGDAEVRAVEDCLGVVLGQLRAVRPGVEVVPGERHELGGMRLAGPGLDGPAGVGEHDADLVGADVVVLVQVEDHLGGNGQHVGSFQTGRGHVAPGFPGATSLVGSEAGDGGVDAVDDGLVQLVPGHGTRGAPSPLDVDL